MLSSVFNLMKYHFTLESRESNEGSWHFRCIPGSNEKSRSDRTSYRISMTSTTANSIDRQLRIFTSLRRPLPFDLLNATQTNICFSSYINFPSIGCSAKSSFVRETRRKSRKERATAQQLRLVTIEIWQWQKRNDILLCMLNLYLIHFSGKRRRK